MIIRHEYVEEKKTCLMIMFFKRVKQPVTEKKETEAPVLQFIYQHNDYSVHQWLRRLEFNPNSSHYKDSKIILDATLLNHSVFQGMNQG